MITKGGVGSGITGHRTIRETIAKLPPKQQIEILDRLNREKEKRGGKKSPNLSQQDINIFIENVLKHIKIKMKDKNL
mgnify:CR=1 FL=1